MTAHRRNRLRLERQARLLRLVDVNADRELHLICRLLAAADQPVDVTPKLASAMLQQRQSRSGRA